MLVPRGSADNCARVWRPAGTREFGYELIEGEVFGYSISRSNERPGGTWVSLGILMNTIYTRWLWRCRGECLHDVFLV